MSPSQNAWRDKALCADDPDLMARAFGDDMDEDEQYTTLDAMEFARDTCLSCPVMIQCLSWEKANPQEFGVYGGLTPRDRGYPVDTDPFTE